MSLPSCMSSASPALGSISRERLWKTVRPVTSVHASGLLPQNSIIGTTVDSTMLSSILNLRSLVARAHISCSDAQSFISRPMDDDMEKPSGALSHLKSPRPLWFCRLSSCSTAIAPLVSISIHRLGLTAPGTHLDRQEITRDLQRLPDGSSRRDEAKYKLQNQKVRYYRLGCTMRTLKLSQWADGDTFDVDTGCCIFPKSSALFGRTPLFRLSCTA